MPTSTEGTARSPFSQLQLTRHAANHGIYSRERFTGDEADDAREGLVLFEEQAVTAEGGEDTAGSSTKGGSALAIVGSHLGSLQ